MRPETLFTKAGDVTIGYQVSGTGAMPLVLLWPFNNIDVMHEAPGSTAFLEGLGTFAGVITFDKRGTGVSDRHVESPTLEERAEDALSVMDAVGVERAALFGVSEGGMLAAYIAATHPDRVSDIILFGTPPRFVRDEEHPWGWATRRETTANAELLASVWGTRDGARAMLTIYAPSLEPDDETAETVARLLRASMARDAVLGHLDVGRDYDLANVFPSVRTRALVLHRSGDALVPVALGRRLAETLPDARFVELAGDEHLPDWGDVDAVVGEVEHFLTGERSSVSIQRRLLTLLLTDIVGSTSKLGASGDTAWTSMLARFDDELRHCIARFGGTEIKQTGDGFMVSFDGPGRAIDCAVAIVEATERLGLDVRTGIHTGECEIRGDDIAGIAVHTASRIADLAQPGRILASRTVVDLVAGSGIRFDAGTEVELDGIADRRTVHEVLHRGAHPSTVRRLAATRKAELTCQGDYWTIGFDGQVAVLRDSAGLADLSRLLGRPGAEIHVLDLAGSTTSVGLASTSAQAVIDDESRAAYKQRLADLEAERDKAAADNDLARVERLDVEHEQIVAEVSAAYGLGERSRDFDDEGERARKAVAKRLRRAIERIEEAHAPLGRHLHATIRTGMYCAYEPDPTVHWNVSR